MGGLQFVVEIAVVDNDGVELVSVGFDDFVGGFKNHARGPPTLWGLTGGYINMWKKRRMRWIEHVETSQRQ